LRSHSIPSPVHSAFFRASSSAPAPMRVVTVELKTSKVVALKSSAREDETEVGWRGRNQLLLKSKKQRSDQWQDVRKRMTGGKLKYTGGRLRKNGKTKKRKTKTGGAFVGMKRRGSQL